MRTIRDLSGARLVGAVTFLNVPFVPFTHDTILTFRFVAEDSVPCIPSAGTCSKPCSCRRELQRRGSLQRRRVLPPRTVPAGRADLVRRRQRVQRVGGLRLGQRRHVRQVAPAAVQRQQPVHHRHVPARFPVRLPDTSRTGRRATTTTSARGRIRSLAVCVRAWRIATRVRTGCARRRRPTSTPDCEDNNVCRPA